MLRLIVVLTLVAVCSAQTRPVIVETFKAEAAGIVKGEVQGNRYSGDGDVIMAEDDNNMRNIFRFFGKEFEFEIVSLWDPATGNSGMRYNVYRTKGGNATCLPEKLADDPYAGVFSWVKQAVFGGEVVKDGVAYDMWKKKETDRVAEVLVERANPNVPVAFDFDMAYGTGEKDLLHAQLVFSSFKDVTPSSSDFKVPKECE